MLGLALSLSETATRGGGSNPYASALLALDFARSSYWESGTAKALNAVTGYAYSDTGGDGVPDITAQGFVPVPAETPILAVASPVTSNVDYVLYGVIDFAAGTDGVNQYFFCASDNSVNNVEGLFRTSAGEVTAVNFQGGTFNTLATGVTLTTERAAVLLRRRAGKLTAMVKVDGGATTVGTESAVLAFPAGVTRLQVAGYAAGTSLPQPHEIERGICRLGTYSDAECTALMTATL